MKRFCRRLALMWRAKSYRLSLVDFRPTEKGLGTIHKGRAIAVWKGETLPACDLAYKIRMQNENGMVTSFVLTAESAAILTAILVKLGAMDIETEGEK